MKHVKLFVLFFFLVPLLLAGHHQTHALTPSGVIEIPGGTISSDTTWTPNNVYVVTGNLSVAENITLTIRPGTVVKFKPRVRLFIDGALDARGTPADPVAFTSFQDDGHGGDTDADGSNTPPKNHDWGWIQFNPTSNDDRSFIQHAFIGYSGYARLSGRDHYGAITLSDASPTLSDITFKDNTINGVDISGGTKRATANVSSETWNNPDVVYVITGNLSVAEGFQLNIEPGMTVKFWGQVRLFVDGALDARGTPANPIVFTSFNDDDHGGDTDADGSNTPPKKHDWGWIQFNPTSNDDRSFIQHAFIGYSGYARLSGRDHYGAITLSDASPSLSDITFKDNTINGVDIPGGTKRATANVSSETWNNPDVVYVITGNLSVAEGFQLNIEPGMTVKFWGQVRLFVDGALDARGTPSDPIAFTSFNDDEHGGDTDADGTNTPPKRHDWAWIEFRATSDDEQSFIQHAFIGYGGYYRRSGRDHFGAVVLFSASPTISNNRIAFNHRGFEIHDESAPIITENHIYGSTQDGILVVNSRPIIRFNAFYDNGAYAVRNDTNTICVNAQNNWWGSADGPMDSSAEQDSCNLGTHDGSGQAVSDNVDYDPWIGAPQDPVGDLYIDQIDVWTDPTTIYEGDLAAIGVNVHSSITHTISEVEVAFYDGDPNGGGQPIGAGTYTIPFITPRGFASQWTNKVWDTLGEVGVHRIYVVVDPDNKITEDNENNNVVVKYVEVQRKPASGGDTEPPTSHLFINNDAPTTAVRDVQLNVEGRDNPGGSGVDKMYFVEIAFNATAQQWLPTQESGWLDYSATYNWQLQPGAGVKYVQAWIADGAGNITNYPGFDLINYIPSRVQVGAGDWHLYHFHYEEGTSATITLETFSGDADLYVWAPGSIYDPDYHSNNAGTAQDVVSFPVPQTGFYQVYVLGHTDSTYNLGSSTTTLDDASALTVTSAATANQEKEIPSAPLTTSGPPERLGVPPVEPPVLGLYLPMIRR